MVFEFNKENLEKSKQIIAKYPHGRQASAVMPLLDLAQRQNGGWLSREVMDYIAQMLDMAAIRVYEVASFYTMYNLKPVGKYTVKVCGTTPCWLRGSDKIMAACQKELGLELGETTKDGKFTLTQIECLCACANAPVVQINDDFYEDLDEESIIKILKSFKAGKKPKHGSQIGRCSSEPMEEKDASR